MAGAFLPGFVSIFMTARFMGLVSHVPGGLGVFEAELPAGQLVPGAVIRYSIVDSLVLFRLICYLVPLATAAIMLGMNEIRRLRWA